MSDGLGRALRDNPLFGALALGVAEKAATDAIETFGLDPALRAALEYTALAAIDRWDDVDWTPSPLLRIVERAARPPQQRRRR